MMKDLLPELFLELPPNAKVLDVGCLNFSAYNRAREVNPKLKHFGIDYVSPENPLPCEYEFECLDLNKKSFPYQDDFFDLVVASHILEHLQDPIHFFGDCLRILKPGGKLYITTPSEKSLRFNGISFAWDQFYSLSFYDDPTHLHRPWTPASLYRLAKYFSAIPLRAGYITSFKAQVAFFFLYPFARIFKRGRLLEKLIWNTWGWSTIALIQKPKNHFGSMNFRYYVPDRK